MRGRLAERVVDQVESTVRLSDHETCVVSAGPRVHRPFVFLHSVGLNHRVWDGVTQRLGPCRRTIAYDIRGHGRAAGAPKPFSIAGLADDLRDLLDALEIGSAHVVGLSLGGAIAQEFALRHPERVSSLALVCTMARGVPAFAERAEDAQLHGVEHQIPMTLERWFTAGQLAEDGEAVGFVREALRALELDDWVAAWHAIAGHDALDRLHAITAPTKVIAGELDPSTPPALMAEIAKRLPSARFDVVPEAPHLLALTVPGTLARLLAT
jgi:3-oxoadipate enol-lactonase